MKRSFSARWRKVIVLLWVLLAAVLPPPIGGAPLTEANVTQVTKDVRLITDQAVARSAVLGDAVESGTTIRTGTKSGVELTFTNRSVIRLAGNTVVTFNKGSRDLTLKEGAMLFQVPKSARGAKVNTGTITAAATGTTGILERLGDAYFKILLLEGDGRVYLPDRMGESVVVRAGQILMAKPEPKTLPEPADYSIEQLYKTSRLITDFMPLASQSRVLKAIQNQKNNPRLVPTNLVIFGRGTVVSLTEPATPKRALPEKAAAKRPSPTPTPTPAP